MCGRMNITDNEGILILMDMIGMPSWPSIQARYNVAPTQELDVLTLASSDSGQAGSETPRYVHQQMHWGLVPPWAKAGQFKRPLINARSETVRVKPSFRHLVEAHRCLLPVTGFYEWQRSGSKKRPFYIYPATGSAMFFGGLYQHNANGNKELTLLTTAANETMAAVHDRMPVIIQPEDVPRWLGCENQPESGTENSNAVEAIDALMRPASNDVLQLHEVSSYVSNARNEGAECSQAIAGSLF